MSRAAKLTLAGTSFMAASTVVFVHYAQQSEKAYDNKLMVTGLKAMHAGVERDIEQQKVKKERQADFEMQKALEEEYRKVQSVHDGATEVQEGSG